MATAHITPSAGKPDEETNTVLGPKALESALQELRLGQDGRFLICYDITSLRNINCLYGRKAGDALLNAVCHWVASLSTGHLYRIEGDLFCILLPGFTLRDTEKVVRRIETRFSQPWALLANGRHLEVFTTATIAYMEDREAFWSAHLPDLFARALDAAKRERLPILFTPEADLQTREDIHLQFHLRKSILQGMDGFDVVYQPIVNAKTGVWQGLEALCRWTSSELGAVPPDVFIPGVERMGLVHRVGEWVLDRALATCKALELEALKDFFVTVNISPMEVARPGFAFRVLSVCEKHDYPCEKLVLEITESTEFNFTPQNRSAVEALRKRGILFALDDFGTGYSGFGNLKRLPVDFLKTERDFIRGIEEDNYLQFFYYIMSETAHASGKRLIAEGVETPQQLSGVVRSGADLVQGYLFSKPLPAQVLAGRLDRFSVPSKNHMPVSEIGNMQMWLRSNDAYKITPSLFGLLSQCMNILLGEEDFDAAINLVLGMMGSHFKVNRAYIFLQDAGTIFSNRYEWCAEGRTSQMHLFQHMDAATDGFYKVLVENNILIATDESQLPPNLLQRLAGGAQHGAIQAMVVMPMRRGEEVLGFVGFDDDHARAWQPEEIIMLHNLCLFTLIVMNTCKEPKKKAADAKAAKRPASVAKKTDVKQ
ncbi:EAL domain-containing protein [Ruminococcaceae bacterium OttesenSCG-928-O06]|nr:EAL domain-containing protein [Ruminococcaceae bacterium OttesenSCG-928-O06]